jgi:hypothetical protein
VVRRARLERGERPNAFGGQERKPDPRVPSHAAEDRLLWEGDRLTRGHQPDRDDRVGMGLMRAALRVVVVLEDELGVVS